jgi:hypothetical protein
MSTNYGSDNIGFTGSTAMRSRGKCLEGTEAEGRSASDAGIAHQTGRCGLWRWMDRISGRGYVSVVAARPR